VALGLGPVRQLFLASIVVGAYVLSGARVAPKEIPQEPAVPNGTAVAYVKGPLSGSYRLAGMLTLDSIPANRSWYCDWLMVVANRKHAVHQPFIQVGLMRWARNKYRLSAFVAKSNGSSAIAFEDAGILPDGPHAVAMRARGDTIHLDVDGREVRAYRLASLFAKDDPLYGQLAGEVVEPGDRIAGTIRAVAIATHGEPPHPYTGRCRYDDRGLRVDTTQGGLVVGGTLDPARKSRFNAACKGFFEV
jgi:hypothetical protein